MNSKQKPSAGPYFNVFHELHDRQSMLLTLFNPDKTEILNICSQAPAPSKDYCQLILTKEKVIFRVWKISLRGDSETRYPRETKDTYEDFVHDENLRRDISRVFGKNTLVYVNNIVENGKLDYICRLPEDILLRIISNMSLEDIARLSQVNSLFRQLCRSDKVWFELYKKYNSGLISKELVRLAEREGWRRLFFTNKIKLQLEIKRQAKRDNQDRQSHDDSIYYTPRLENRRSTSTEFQRVHSKLAQSTFITEQ